MWALASAPPSQAGSAEAAQSSPATASATGESSFEPVSQHLRASILPETLERFGLFIYVNMATSGPSAQQMYVFEKSPDGTLRGLYDWPVSTGRGTVELDPHGHLQSSVTPRGFFELDPTRLYEDHVSSQWDEPMPYAMFFSWKPNGRATGLAIHGTDDQDALGTPASAGCIRLSRDHAEELFTIVKTRFHAPTPQLAYLDGSSGVSSEGLLLHDRDGKLKTNDGYSVLVMIDDFDQETVVASLP